MPGQYSLSGVVYYARKMNEFDLKAAEWDKNTMHRDRAEKIAAAIIRQIPLNRGMTAMEFGAGTGHLSFILKDHLKEITLIDSSEGMVKVLHEKLRTAKTDNLKVVKADLENEIFPAQGFDLIFTHLVLHHVEDVDAIIKKFSNLLNPGGFIAVADLYTEDGSFHGEGFHGHRGFDPDALADLLQKYGFTDIRHSRVYTINRPATEDAGKQFGVFLLTAKRQAS